MNFHNLWGPEFTSLHEKPDCHTHQLTILILLAILCGVSWISDFKKIIHNENYLRLVFLRQLLTIFWYTNLKTISPKKRVSFKLHVSEARYDFDYKRAFKNKLFILQHDVKYAELITKL